MKINFIYRSAPGDAKSAARPDYFDKRKCLKSFLSAFSELPIAKRGDLIFLNDGEMSEEYKQVVNEFSSNEIQLGGVGNSKSLRAAHEVALSSNFEENDLVYFAEDDYLYKKEAFILLSNAAEDIPEADYFTLYDHPDRYTRTDDVNKGLSNVFVSRDCHWRSVESTCQTYCVRLKSFRKDRNIHYLGTSLKVPRGREMFRLVQGIGKYFWRFPKHKLIAPMPGLATHMETKFLSNLVDWQKINSSI